MGCTAWIGAGVRSQAAISAINKATGRTSSIQLGQMRRLLGHALQSYASSQLKLAKKR